MPAFQPLSSQTATEFRAWVNNQIPIFYSNIISYICPELKAGSSNLCSYNRAQGNLFHDLAGLQSFEHSGVNTERSNIVATVGKMLE